jgi:hypothetical protein
MSETQAAASEIEQQAEEAVFRVEDWTRRAAGLARKTAERVPAAVVVVVGGAVLLASDAFGIGEVVTAGIAGYAAYRLLRRRVAKKIAKKAA